ncbi:hypothetical protein KR018_001001 [Drosophila ironensis]|nr:hypothetical protein KR018_001001 [Drosophila ironensis]
MGVKKHISEAPLSKSNSVELYRPPALRNNSSSEEAAAPNESSAGSGISAAGSATGGGIKDSGNREQQAVASAAAAAAATRRQRRPDRAVYVPRARRSQTTPPTSSSGTALTTLATTIATGTPAPVASLPPPSPVALPPPAVADTTPVADTHSSKADEANGQQQPKPRKSQSHRERRERVRKIAVAAVKEEAAAPTENTVLVIAAAAPTEKPTENTVIVIAGTENEAENEEPAKPADTKSNCDTEVGFGGQLECFMNHHNHIFIHTQIMSGVQRTKPSPGSKSAKNGKKQPAPPLRIEDVAPARTNSSGEEAAKCDNDVRELQRASKEINRSNRRIMKQTFVSDVLEIPEKIDAPVAPAPVKPPVDSTTEDDDEEEDEDDWENMFDESGDCLDPKILQELNESVGKCKIELPQMDYTVFHVKQSLLNEEEFPHVLEVSNFPAEFKTPDLLMLFSQYKGSGFDIKWVDDTHALAVFSSSRIGGYNLLAAKASFHLINNIDIEIAAEVLTNGHPFVKVKPLAEATLESRLKAKKAGATSMQPYRQRPETCTALARRLVSGALGVKLPTAPQERENERRVLREAKERKLLAAKQRDEVWES